MSRVYTVNYWEDYNSALGLINMVDVAYCCSIDCMGQLIREQITPQPAIATGNERFLTAIAPAGQCPEALISWGMIGGSEETQSDTYCGHCGDHMWHGLSCYQNDWCDNGLPL